jgi:hypothetical protein
MFENLPKLFASLSLGVTTIISGVTYTPTPTVTATPTPMQLQILETPPVTLLPQETTPSPIVTPEIIEKPKFKIGLQIGHWKNHELPDELSVLRRNDGAHAAGKQEEEINMEIVNQTAEILKQDNIEVEILPATVPPGYKADAFITVHADGNPNPEKSGYKMSTSIGDRSGKGDTLVKLLEEEYAKSTNLPYDPYITDNMLEYYSFAYWRFEHSIDPATPSAIVETGYLTSPHDRTIIVDNPHKSADGIANAIKRFLSDPN